MAAKGNIEAMKALLSHQKVDPNGTRHHTHPLVAAMTNNHTAVVRLLISDGRVDVNSDSVSSFPSFFHVSTVRKESAEISRCLHFDHFRR
jgi:hypothetical protein